MDVVRTPNDGAFIHNHNESVDSKPEAFPKKPIAQRLTQDRSRFETKTADEENPSLASSMGILLNVQFHSCSSLFFLLVHHSYSTSFFLGG